MAARDQIRCPQCGVPNEPGALFCARCGASQNRPGYRGNRRRRVSLAGFTMALALLLALGVTVFVLYTIVNREVLAPTTTTAANYSGVVGTLATLVTSTTADTSTGSGSDTTGAATGTTTGAATGETTNDTTNDTTAGGAGGSGAVLVRPHAATASSSLKATSTTDFRPTNLLDGDMTSAWMEGAPGSGVGEWVRLEFDDVVSLDHIEIANGYQKDPEHFAAEERVKSLLLQYSDGTTQTIELVDAEGLQVIHPNAKGTQWIKLTILSVYPSYQLEDAALSEVRTYETVQ